MTSLMSQVCCFMTKIPFTNIIGKSLNTSANKLNSTLICNGYKQFLSPVSMATSCYNSSRPCSSDSKKSYAPPSPYRRPGPRNYGYENKLFAGGLMPRLDKEIPKKILKPYKPKNNWDREHALFGQNDYIDILGSGNIHPVHLIKGPEWLIGWKGNEMQRLIRMLRMRGKYIKDMYPTEYHNTMKRIKFLYKKYNQKRGRRIR